jgi:glycosyltransferase involved in cell wall biosynthesis
MVILNSIVRMALGGAERQLVQLSSGLCGRDVEVHVATAHPGYCDRQLEATGAVLHRLRALGKYDITLIPRMARLIRRLRPDVVATWLPQMDIVTGIAARMANVPWIVCERSAAEAYPPGVLLSLRTRLVVHADAVIANSEVGRQYWRRYVDEARIHVIPNIVPLPAIERASATTESPGGEDVILYVGRFSAEKNLDRLIEALASVLPGRRAKAVFCGDGPLRGAMEQKAAALGIADRMLFLGEVADVWGWMKRAAVVVGVSVFEGNPNTALEAIACGAPLVVSDIPAYRALVDGHSAWLVDPLSAESIAGGLRSALGDRAEAKARAERARTVVAGRSADDIAARYIEVFENVVKRKTQTA